MTMPVDFRFSQSNLQDYVDCPRRFELRHLQHIAWPAVEVEPLLEHERHRKLGEFFHRLVQQHLLGVPVERLSRMAAGLRLGGPELESWWQNYLKSAITTGASRSPGKYYPEISLVGSIGGANLTAKYDVVLVNEGSEGTSCTILDWKTTHRRTQRSWLSSRLQTRVYLYLMTAAGECLNGGISFAPGQVEMIYWFAGFPNESICFNYFEGQFEEDRRFLANLIKDIQAAGNGDFQACTDPQNCLFCVYRSFCERGVKPGMYWDETDGEGFPQHVDALEECNDKLDFEQIAEIEF
jgi:hypothetical protein